MFKEMCEAAENVGFEPCQEQSFPFEHRWPTSDELAGMLKPDNDRSFILWHYDFPTSRPAQWRCRISNDLKPIYINQYFDTLPEALLFAVMFEKGWLWTGQTFTKQEGR